jgi:hypothetical protein
MQLANLEKGTPLTAGKAKNIFCILIVYVNSALEHQIFKILISTPIIHRELWG